MPNQEQGLEPNRYGNPLRIHVDAMQANLDKLRNRYPNDGTLNEFSMQWGGLLDFVVNPRLEEQGEDGYM